MRQKRYTHLAFFLGAFLLSGAVFSATDEREALAAECKFLGSSLNQLANAPTQEYCTTDMRYSGQLMEQSASLIQKNRLRLALVNLNLVVKTLKEVMYNHGRCPYFSTMAGPFRDKVGALIVALERAERIS